MLGDLTSLCLLRYFLKGFSHLFRLQCVCLYSSTQLGVLTSDHSQARKTKGRGIQTILPKEKRTSQV